MATWQYLPLCQVDLGYTHLQHPSQDLLRLVGSLPHQVLEPGSVLIGSSLPGEWRWLCFCLCLCLYLCLFFVIVFVFVRVFFFFCLCVDEPGQVQRQSSPPGGWRSQDSSFSVIIWRVWPALKIRSHVRWIKVDSHVNICFDLRVLCSKLTSNFLKVARSNRRLFSHHSALGIVRTVQ